MAKAAKIEAIGILQLWARSGENGKLFGAVTTKELSHLISEKSGIEVDRKNLKDNHPEIVQLIQELAEPVRTLPRGAIDRRAGSLDAWDDLEDD